MENQEQWLETKFRFANGVEFTIVHNLPENGPINSIQAAFDNWLPRTDKYTVQSFVDYINSKGVHKAMTKEQYDLLKK